MDVGYENEWHTGTKMFLYATDHSVSLFVNLSVVPLSANQPVGLSVG